MRTPNRADYIQTIRRAEGRPQNKQLREEAKAARKALKELDKANADTD